WYRGMVLLDTVLLYLLRLLLEPNGVHLFQRLIVRFRLRLQALFDNLRFVLRTLARLHIVT
ncbi:MAG: hypothetical protein L6Q38_04125, partial [Nitrospira sp.]|nr:hypothetical protein [Nitrospira sp.]